MGVLRAFEFGDLPVELANNPNGRGRDRGERVDDRSRSLQLLGAERVAGCAAPTASSMNASC